MITLPKTLLSTRQAAHAALLATERLETMMSTLTEKLDRLADAWEADEANDAAILAEVVRTRDEAVAARDEALANDEADQARISELESDVNAANTRLDELLDQYAPEDAGIEEPVEEPAEPGVEPVEPGEEPGAQGSFFR